MGGMGNVVVNTVVRMFTRKAVKSAKPASGKSKKAGPKKKDSAKGKKGAR
jgi:hypothetical protein